MPQALLGFLATVRVLGPGFSVALAGAIFTSLGGARAGALLAQNTTGQSMSFSCVSACPATLAVGVPGITKLVRLDL